jgi:hypothetical protein
MLANQVAGLTGNRIQQLLEAAAGKLLDLATILTDQIMSLGPVGASVAMTIPLTVNLTHQPQVNQQIQRSVDRDAP